jgi:hypothetical protein
MVNPKLIIDRPVRTQAINDRSAAINVRLAAISVRSAAINVRLVAISVRSAANWLAVNGTFSAACVVVIARPSLLGVLWAQLACLSGDADSLPLPAFTANKA